MPDGNVNFGNSLIRTLSANVAVTSLLIDQYIGQANLVETLSNVQFISTGTYSRYTPIMNQQSGNIVVASVAYDPYIGQANLVETVANVQFSANVVRSDSKATSPNTTGITPLITYSVSDGNPIVIFSGQEGNAVIPAPTTTQYWTTT